MNRTARVILLSILVCSLDLLATDTPTFTLKGAVVTPDGTMVPEFTVTVRAIVDKPELVPRKRFKDGVFTFTGLRRTPAGARRGSGISRWMGDALQPRARAG